jgi:hypothetical protein
MTTKTQANSKKQPKNVAGGSPSSGGPKGKAKQKDDAAKPSKTLANETAAKSEKDNMTDNKGYNETPPTVPVKSVTKK